MFSQTAEYALRVAVFLATRGTAPVTTRQIALATRVPEGYLAKVLQSLNKAGLIQSQRGLHGGSTLARESDDLTVFDVIQAVDPIPRIVTCPLGIQSHGPNLCPLHRRMDNAYAMVERALRESTLADLVNERNGSVPLCETPESKELVTPTVGKKRMPPLPR